MKKILGLMVVLCLMACSHKQEVWYFVPEIELASGELVQTETFPVPTLQDCQHVADEFTKAMQDAVMNGEVLSYSADCIHSELKLVKPTALPGTKHVSQEGTI